VRVKPRKRSVATSRSGAPKASRAGGRTLAELAETLGARVSGDARVRVSGVDSLDRAGPADVSWVADARRSEHVARSRAGAFIVREAADAAGRPALVVENPQLALARCLEILRPGKRPRPGVARGARVHPTARLERSVSVAAGATVGARARVGARTILREGVFVGEDAQIGEDCDLHPNAVVQDRCRIGDRCILHPGAVIGSDGFGYVREGSRHRKIPQVGIARLEDDVEVGANSCVDRATLGETVVGRGTKIDNLVQIGHNVVVGEDSILCGQVGLAGSARLGRGVTLAGQVGVGDHLTVGDGAIATGQAGITASVPAGATVSGMPAVPHREFLRKVALAGRLPDVLRRVLALEERLARIEGR
jgi:UDP-3-O-[3-hydroxymyristoyl] glucosamine N-acyltransferase